MSKGNCKYAKRNPNACFERYDRCCLSNHINCDYIEGDIEDCPDYEEQED